MRCFDPGPWQPHDRRRPLCIRSAAASRLGAFSAGLKISANPLAVSRVDGVNCVSSSSVTTSRLIIAASRCSAVERRKSSNAAASPSSRSLSNRKRRRYRSWADISPSRISATQSSSTRVQYRSSAVTCNARSTRQSCSEKLTRSPVRVSRSAAQPRPGLRHRRQHESATGALPRPSAMIAQHW
jgi:hypothetical protein